ncbi:unnamed protein product, partial [marine sediment metagenome]
MSVNGRFWPEAAIEIVVFCKINILVIVIGINGEGSMSEKDTHNEMTANDVNVVTTSIGPNQFKIVATATFNSNPSEIWALLWDWEQLLAVGLPGMTDNFQWLSGGPDEIPSTFQFEIGGVTIKEEIYERTMEHRYCLRYRTLEPALGILDYEAVIELDPIDEIHT